MPIAAYKIQQPSVRVFAIKNRLDLVLFELAEGSPYSGCFTRNAFCAAPVTLARKHLVKSAERCATCWSIPVMPMPERGDQGLCVMLWSCCLAVGRCSRCLNVTQVLPFSTGVIGERLPAEKIAAAVPEAMASLEDGWLAGRSQRHHDHGYASQGSVRLN
jgi:glutamate N-acetyltransferase / amino-acid N-acetyltransferase